MAKNPASLSLLAVLPLALASCASPDAAGPIDWARPLQPATSTPVFLHNLAIANPPYPLPHYENYLDEPTRFEFRPRPPLPQTPDDTPDDSAGPAPDDGSYLENGILYVDPNQ